ncbi:MAG TPA: Cof-type HAD-IIB family hydrolase [Nocardioides sp.]|jgi:HAD superfamily hydrolase (TIGR01484 family)|nr:Cof-type HAD-IIB family hydrolase [Nocardioides sp.]
MTTLSLPRLVATDLDGTLLDDAGLLSERTRDVLRRVQQRGVRVVIVTARPLRWMDELWAQVGGGRGVGIVSNGAITYDVGSREVLELRGISAEVGLPMVEAIREAAPGAAIALECLGGYRHEPAYVDLHPTPPDMRVGDLAELWDEPAVKVLAQHLTLDPDDFRARVIDAVGESATPTWTIDHLMEISAAGVTKGGALAALCERLGVGPDEVVAFGDMPNDLAMLRWAGTSYAVANGHESVLEAADHVAPRNSEDGVAVVLARVFGL